MSEDNTDQGRFEDSSITRRDFARLTAATGAALALPGNATADATADAFTDEYQYVLNHTPADYEVPTLVQFSEESGPSAMESAVDTEVITTMEPEPAAYGQLTTAQAGTVAELPEASTFQFSPGSNPFWRIGYYPMGVFPEPRRSVDFVGFEQLKDGLREVENRYPDRVNVTIAGRSPGHTNRATDRPDPKQMMVAEVTNFDSETDFADKEKVFFSCSLHGLERAGAETGARVVENVARSSEPDIEGNEEKIEPYLDDVVVLIGFTNPDGWVARNPQYDSKWQFNGPDIPAAPLYERGNAEVYDTNRQYPTMGHIDPSHYPAHPSDGVGDPPSFVHEKVPDAAAFVDFFSDYENLNYGADLHGGPIFNEFVLGLISQDQFDTRQLHELYEMCLNIDETLEAALDTWVTAGNIKKMAVGDTETGLLFGVLPEQAFDYSTIYDTIDYTVSGAFLDWMAHPEPIGLDLTTLDFEMAFSHLTGGNVYNPELLEMEVKGYRTAMRTITAFAVRNSDTPTTGDQFEAYTESGGDSVAYVTPGNDALRSTDDELSFTGDSGGDSNGSGTDVSRTSEAVTLSADTTELTFRVTEPDLHSLGFHLHADRAVADLEVVDPDGAVVGEFEAVTEERAGGKCCGLPEFSTTDPAAGEWTVRVHNRRDVEEGAEFARWTLAASGENPDPNTAWDGEGFVQREYDVTPFEFFEDYEEFIVDGGTVDAVTVADVANGALVDDSGAPAYDHVVVIHDYGANADANADSADAPNDAANYIGNSGVFGYSPADHPVAGYEEPGYADALDEYVDGGGNLVLTDAGVNLVTELDSDLVNGDRIDREDIVIPQFRVARFAPDDPDQKNLGHPLFGKEGDVRPIQNQLWKVAPLGYEAGNAADGQAPMFLLDEEGLAAAGEPATATVAGRSENNDGEGSGIAAASLTPDDSTGRGIHLITSLLPPATQKNLHPFGLQNYTVTFLGYVMLTSALGWEQVRNTGQTTRRYGRGDQWDASDVEHLNPPGVSASGSREDDGTVFTGGQTNQVEITVDQLSHGARIYDRVPTEWTVHVGGGDARAVEERDGTTFVDLGTLGPIGADESGETLTYFAEAPSGAGNSGEYTFGPARAETGESGSDFAGTDTNYVVGADQNEPTDSATGGAGDASTAAGSDAATDAGGSSGSGSDGVVDTATDALDD